MPVPDLNRADPHRQRLRRPDTPNPGSLICFCGSPIPRIGLSLGVWEPAWLMDVTRAPWCFPNLGGLTIDPGLLAARGRTASAGGDGAKGSVWHAHFHRPYKRLGVGKGDELRVAGVDRKSRTVMLEGREGQPVAWEPNRIAARTGGVEVYRSEEIELRAGDRVRWTRNDAGLGLVNSGAAEVAAVRDGRVTFRLEDGRTLDLAPGDPQLRHVDRAWASTVHAFQGRTVDTVIAAMEANHPHLTTQKSFYVEISRARDRAELVTDDRGALKEQLEAATGERIAALEASSRTRRRGVSRTGHGTGCRPRERCIRIAGPGPDAGDGAVPCAEGARPRFGAVAAFVRSPERGGSGIDAELCLCGENPLRESRPGVMLQTEARH